jgi:hypothetical protein
MKPINTNAVESEPGGRYGLTNFYLFTPNENENAFNAKNHNLNKKLLTNIIHFISWMEEQFFIQEDEGNN